MNKKLPTEIHREELYEKVWSVPLVKLAKEYGISDVALAKICKKINVPRPLQGHWRRVELGKKTKAIPLPKPEKDAPLVAKINRNNIGKQKPLLSPEAANDPESIPIDLPNDLRGCHRLVTSLRRSLESAHYPRHGLLSSDPEQCIEVRVSKDSQTRTLLICEAIVRACEARGWSVTISKEKRATYVQINEDPVRFSMREKVNRIEVKPGSFWDRFEYRPSSRLILEIKNAPYGSPVQEVWMDGKISLEDQLPNFIAALAVYSEAIKEQRLACIAAEERRRIKEQKHDAFMKRIKAERGRRDQLKEFAVAWKEAQLVREFCSELEARSQHDPESYPPEQISKWIQWARSVTDRSDPFKAGTLARALMNTKLEAALDCSKDISIWDFDDENSSSILTQLTS